MTDTTMFRKIITIISSSAMVYVAIFELIHVGLLTAKSFILSKLDIFPTCLKSALTFYYGLFDHSLLYAIGFAVSSVCLIISVIATLTPIIRKDTVPNGHLVFQKFSCFLSFVFFFLTAVLSFIDIHEIGVFMAILIERIFHWVYFAHVLAIAFLFVLSSGTKKS